MTDFSESQAHLCPIDLGEALAIAWQSEQTEVAAVLGIELGNFRAGVEALLLALDKAASLTLIIDGLRRILKKYRVLPELRDRAAWKAFAADNRIGEPATSWAHQNK